MKIIIIFILIFLSFALAEVGDIIDFRTWRDSGHNYSCTIAYEYKLVQITNGLAIFYSSRYGSYYGISKNLIKKELYEGLSLYRCAKKVRVTGSVIMQNSSGFDIHVTTLYIING